MNATNDALVLVLSKLGSVRPNGGAYMACCPAHDDNQASLSLRAGDSQPVVFTCHAGCERDAILDGLGLTWAEVCEARKVVPLRRGEWTPRGDATEVYTYTDELGEMLYQILRTLDKQFPVRVPDAGRKTGWRWNMGDTRRVPYRLPKVVEAVKNGEIIYIPEGEKDVHALETAGVTATCNPFGAGKWRAEYAAFFEGAIVQVIADRDVPGQSHAREVAASLKGIATAVEITEAAEGCKDVSDHLAAGHSLAELQVTWQSDPEPEPDLAPDLYAFLSVVDPPSDWVIPGLLERGDRLLLTGFEGQGKSVAIRQIAVAAAAGTHPFTGEPIEPQRVLFIDCENPDRKSRRHFRRLEYIARAQGFPVPEGGFRIIQRPGGIDLTREDDAAWLLERVTAHQPGLLAIGPFYRLHAKDTNEEMAARAVVSALDRARLKCDCALITEAHAGHGDSANRSVRPAGSSLLLRWPEFGYGLKPKGDDVDENGHSRRVRVVPWRGPREERHWPRELVWGTRDSDWPWVPADGSGSPWTPMSCVERTG
jgi:AAA domain